MVARVAVIAGLLVAAACSKSSDAPASGPAGRVEAISGSATATRAAAGSAARPLGEGDEVFADDTIATAEGATVRIALAHNGATWELTGNLSRRVDESPAWRAAKASGESTFAAGDPDRTTAAGRHTERMEAPGAPPPAAAAPPPPPSPDPEPEPEREVRRRLANKMDDSPKDRRSPMDGLIEKEKVEDDDEAPRKLTRAEIAQGMKKVIPAVTKCGDKHGVTGVSIAVRVSIAKGAVAGAEASGDHAGTPVGNCVAGAVKNARFPEHREPLTVMYPFRL
jgi:hypothetical protein